MAKLNKSTGKEKVKPIRIQASPASEHREYASDEVNEFGEYIKIGGSPVPGLTLRHVLRGHTDVINGIAWSPDGKYLASSSYDKTIRIFDVNTGECACVLEGHTDGVNCVAWSPNGSKFASGALNGELKIWGVKDNAKLNILFTLDRGKKYRIYSIHWSRNGSFIAAQTNGGVIFIDIKSNYSTKYELSAGGATSWCHNINMLAFAGNFDNAFYVRNFDKKFKTNKFDLNASGFINCLCWSPDDRLLALGDMKKNDLLVWDSESKEIVHKLHGHPNLVLDLFWISSKILASVSHADPTVRIWDVEKGEQIICLEGHVDLIKEIVISNDRSLIASAARDNTVKIWDANRFILLATINKIFNDDRIDIEFSFDNLSLAITSNNEKIILLWELDKSVLLGQAEESVNYTTAKLVLVGDSGVGKTGLGWRLAHNEFKEQASTHGQQFWPVSQLNLKRKDGTDCEAVLWDLAGQHVYRQVHSIFLDNVAAAMVLFDPTNRQEPLKGAQFWLEQLKGKGELPPTVLVGARVDRGAPALSQAELDQFCQRYGIKGGYISTSAMNGDGLEALLDILKEQIPWDEMTATVTTVTFKRIKDYVLSLKEKTDRKGVLVAPDALRAQLQATDSEWSFTDAEMMTAVGHLETHGYVSILSNSAGDKFILLTPELLASLAASIMLLADKNPRELGAVNETELLGGKISFDDLKGLEKEEPQILIDAAILRFLEHNICFRETLNSDTLLIFPSLIKQKRPLQDDLPATDDISYVVRGRVENLYASLVVLLGYTPSFMRINQWQNQAQYEMREGEICGFRMIEEREGEIELILYYGDTMPQSGRDKFQELFEQFLYMRDVDVTRFPPVVCSKNHRIERATVVKRVREGKDFVFCDECGEKVTLPDFDKPQTIGIGASPWLQREEAMARLRSLYEQHLTKIKSYRRGWAIPRAYISRLPEQERWAAKLIHDLRDAGVLIVERIEELQADDFVIVLSSTAYERAFQSASSDLASDAQEIRARLGNGKKKVLSLACEGKPSKHAFEECDTGNFCDETHYAVSLFNLVLELYAIPLNHKGFEPLRLSLHQQWEQTLAGKAAVVESTSKALKLFISYSHADEVFKDELVKMLAGFQRRGIIDAWQDRRIEAGDEWLKAIKSALNECDMALLLVSADFIASPFINDEELPALLQRRESEGMIVVPIIVRDCPWRSEPVLKDLQALPKDAQPVNTFPRETGERDRIWTTIAQEIEKRSNEKR